MPAKPLTLEQKQDAKRLRAVYDERKNRLGLSQEKLADEFGFSVQSAVSQYLTGKIPLNIEISVKFAERLRCRVSDFSPSMQREIDCLSEYASGNASPCGKPVGASVKPDKNIARFEFLDVRTSCEPGVINDDYPVAVRSIEMPVEAARELIGRADEMVKIVRASNDSMKPTIQPKDVLFVDTSVTDFKGEGVYLICHNNELLCKRLQVVGKVLTVISDNNFYKTWPWEERPKDTRIVGRVLRALPMDFKDFGGDAK